MKSSLITAIVILVITFTSCQKEDTQALPLTKTELISSSTWKFDTAGIDADKNGSMDTPLPPGILQNCDKDNTLTFNANGSGTVDEGATKCDAANPQSTPFTWTFANNETAVTFSDSLFSAIDGNNVNILSLTDTKLELSKDVTVPGPLTLTVIIRLKH